jgi:AcrR family transcriptional regulator
LPYHHGNLRDAVLERAAQVIAEHGVEAVSLRALARDLGVSHAAPARHFADRRALLCELAKEGFRRSVSAMNLGAQAAGDDPVARYRALGRSYVRFACENPAYFRATTHPEVRTQDDEEFQQVRQDFYRTLRDGALAAKAAGWHPEADTDALVAFSTAAAMGAAELLTDGRVFEILKVESVELLADAVLDLVVHRSRLAAVPASAKRARPATAKPASETKAKPAAVAKAKPPTRTASKKRRLA